MTENQVLAKVEKTVALPGYGNRDTVRELAERIKMMLPGGTKYTNEEALTLAQIAVAHDLDPFNGEVWLIKNEDTGKVYGALPGLKGLRKHAKKQAVYWGAGANSGFERITDPAEMEKYGAKPGDILFIWRFLDTITLNAYSTSLAAMTKAGIPQDEAQKMLGSYPVNIGIGLFSPGEKTKMKPHQCAMYRAEKDGLRRRFDLNFGFIPTDTPSELIEAIDVVEVEAEEVAVEKEAHRDPDEILAELGYGPNGTTKATQAQFTA